MKFEYEEKERDDECVAFIGKGNLVIKSYCGGSIMITDHSGSYVGVQDFKAYMATCGSEVARKFYPGDKITITF